MYRPVARGVRGVRSNPPFDHNLLYTPILIYSVQVYTYTCTQILKITLLITAVRYTLFHSFSIVKFGGHGQVSGCGRENFRAREIKIDTQILATGLMYMLYVHTCIIICTLYKRIILHCPRSSRPHALSVLLQVREVERVHCMLYSSHER